MNQQPIESLKGIGEKTGALFRKLGVGTVEELLHYYPRGYDAYEPPVAVGQVKEGGVLAVSGVLLKSADVKRFRNLQVVTATVKDMTGSLQLTWFNMPFLRNTLKMGAQFVFRGRVVKKQGRLCMEQPEIFTPDVYGRSCTPCSQSMGRRGGLAIRPLQKRSHRPLSSGKWSGNTCRPG